MKVFVGGPGLLTVHALCSNRLLSTRRSVSPVHDSSYPNFRIFFFVLHTPTPVDNHPDLESGKSLTDLLLVCSDKGV
jgi:hypothetical protein